MGTLLLVSYGWDEQGICFLPQEAIILSLSQSVANFTTVPSPIIFFRNELSSSFPLWIIVLNNLLLRLTFLQRQSCCCYERRLFLQFLVIQLHSVHFKITRYMLEWCAVICLEYVVPVAMPLQRPAKSCLMCTRFTFTS